MKHDRAIELMKLAAEYIETYWPEGTIEYDETECDGGCLSEDLLNAAEELESQQ